MTDVIEVSGGIQLIDVVTGEIEIIEIAAQGPPGPQGESGFSTGIDIISGGTPTTDYTNEYQFDGGTP